MSDRLEGWIKAVYQQWKAGNPQLEEGHPDEEAMACFLENKLSAAESESIKEHLITCSRCSEIMAMCLKLEPAEIQEIPQESMERIKELLNPSDTSSVLEIILRLKEKALEILNTTGDVLVGQELVPAALLRSRPMQDFKDEVVILKDFQDIRVEVKIENKAGEFFNFTVTARQKQSQKVIKDLRVSLMKGDLELESRLSDTGTVTFEHVLLGKYKVEITTLENRLASLLLEIKV